METKSNTPTDATPPNAGQPAQTIRRLKNHATGEEREVAREDWAANEKRLRGEGFVPAEEPDERLPVEKVPGGQGTPDGFSNGTTKVYR